jgi:hypothetical protein
LDFTANGGKDRALSAPIVAGETGREAPGLESPITFDYRKIQKINRDGKA